MPPKESWVSLGFCVYRCTQYFVLPLLFNYLFLVFIAICTKRKNKLQSSNTYNQVNKCSSMQNNYSMHISSNICICTYSVFFYQETRKVDKSTHFQPESNTRETFQKRKGTKGGGTPPPQAFQSELLFFTFYIIQIVVASSDQLC